MWPNPDLDSVVSEVLAVASMCDADAVKEADCEKVLDCGDDMDWDGRFAAAEVTAAITRTAATNKIFPIMDFHDKSSTFFNRQR